MPKRLEAHARLNVRHWVYTLTALLARHQPYTTGFNQASQETGNRLRVMVCKSWVGSTQPTVPNNVNEVRHLRLLTQFAISKVRHDMSQRSRSSCFEQMISPPWQVRLTPEYTVSRQCTTHKHRLWLHHPATGFHAHMQQVQHGNRVYFTSLKNIQHSTTPTAAQHAQLSYYMHLHQADRCVHAVFVMVANCLFPDHLFPCTSDRCHQ
ncbi:hypothetical protein V8C86DRAFT_288517 [Haematococcus lacustris]